MKTYKITMTVKTLVEAEGLESAYESMDYYCSVLRTRPHNVTVMDIDFEETKEEGA